MVATANLEPTQQAEGGVCLTCACTSRLLLLLLLLLLSCQVDGRDQHCAFILWLLIVLVFLVYGALVFYGPILQARAHSSS